MNIKVIKSLLGMGRKKYDVQVIDHKTGLIVKYPLDEVLKRVEQRGGGAVTSVRLQHLELVVQESQA